MTQNELKEDNELCLKCYNDYCKTTNSEIDYVEYENYYFQSNEILTNTIFNMIEIANEEE
jgi:hypothetical protein